MYYAILKETNIYGAEIHEFITVNEAITFTQEPDNKDYDWIIVQDYKGEIKCIT